MNNSITDNEKKAAADTSFNKYWLMILYVIQKLNQKRYTPNVRNNRLQNICYILTYADIPTGFTFTIEDKNLYSFEAERVLRYLSYAYKLTATKNDILTEMVVPDDFSLPDNQFSDTDMKKVGAAIDLLSRIKSDEHAEMISAVLFSYKNLLSSGTVPTDAEVFDNVLELYKEWKNKKESEIIETIYGLASLEWIKPVFSGKLVLPEDDI